MGVMRPRSAALLVLLVLCLCPTNRAQNSEQSVLVRVEIINHLRDTYASEQEKLDFTLENVFDKNTGFLNFSFTANEKLQPPHNLTDFFKGSMFVPASLAHFFTRPMEQIWGHIIVACSTKCGRGCQSLFQAYRDTSVSTQHQTEPSFFCRYCTGIVIVYPGC